MDPNANLARQLSLAADVMAGSLSDGDIHDHALELAEHVLALHDWLSKGGMLPDAWLRGRRKPREHDI